MIKKIVFVFLICFILLLGVGAWIANWMSERGDDGASKYVSVAMTNGDIYFGRAHWIPSFYLSGAWVLERRVDGQNQIQLGVNPITKAFWRPVDKLYVNYKNVLTWSPLRNDSQMIPFLEDPNRTGNVLGNPATSELTGSSASQTEFKGPNSPPPVSQ